MTRTLFFPPTTLPSPLSSVLVGPGPGPRVASPAGVAVVAVAGASAGGLLAAGVGACSAVGRTQKLVVVPEQVDWIE